MNANLPEEVRESDFVVHPESVVGDMNSNVVGLHVDLDQVEVLLHDKDTLNFVGFQTVEDIIKFYKLTTKKTRRTTSKAIFEGLAQLLMIPKVYQIPLPPSTRVYHIGF